MGHGTYGCSVVNKKKQFCFKNFIDSNELHDTYGFSVVNKQKQFCFKNFIDFNELHNVFHISCALSSGV